MKNTMVTGITQKSYKALFLLWSLKKKRYIEIDKLKMMQRKGWKHWKESWNWNKGLGYWNKEIIKNDTCPIFHEF